MSNARYTLDGKTESPIDRKLTRLLYVSTAKYGGDWYSLKHTHACTELFYVVGGIGQFHVDGKLLPVTTDDLIIVNPNVEHTEVSLNASPLEYIVLGVEGMEFSADEDSESGYTLFSLHNRREEVLPYLRGMLWEIESKQTGCEVVCQDLLEVVVVKLLRHTGFSIAITPGHRGSKECAVVKRYLDNNFKESITLDFLAELAHVNKYYLVHSFRREYNITPISYLVERRIKESQFLLTDTNYSLSQISQALGFSSLSYFSQSFHKVAGMSPLEYRRSKLVSTDSDKGEEEPRK